MKRIVIDLNRARTMEQIQDTLQKQLKLPDYYGKNLDALYEVLTEWQEPLLIEVAAGDNADDMAGDNADSAADGMSDWGRRLKKLLRVLADACEDNPLLQVKTKKSDAPGNGE